MFFRRRTAPPELVLDDDALDRAIRAGVQFPLAWFLEQTPEVQEAIAARRDAWLEDVLLAAGYAAQDPARMHLAGLAEDGDEDAEAALAELNARAVAERMGRHAAGNGASQDATAKRATMGGVGKRRQEAAAAREAAQENGSLAEFGGQPGGRQ